MSTAPVTLATVPKKVVELKFGTANGNIHQQPSVMEKLTNITLRQMGSVGRKRPATLGFSVAAYDGPRLA